MHSGNNKKRNVLINMRSIQKGYDSDIEIKFATEGTLRPIEGGFEIEYDESETTGYANCTTLITCLGNRFASLTRSGAISSELVLEIGKKHHCHYDTPYGSMMMGIYAKSIENTITEMGGELVLKYSIDVDSAFSSDNEVFLSIEKR